jgi:NAD(P)-dependent dehydrogenase (short-subunit alcohol dehydrogenase family)
VESLDLANGFDVTSWEAWQHVGPVDVACLNAGVLTGELGVESYRRSVAVNVDGVVLGVLRLREVMRHGAIVATASLAGLTGMSSDPVYALTKHAVVGFVRSMATHLAPVRLNAICPGYTDTPMVDGERDEIAARGVPLLAPEDVADGMWRAVAGGGSGECWFVQPGRAPEPFRFANLPGPR